jgi:hypothetical protein
MGLEALLRQEEGVAFLRSLGTLCHDPPLASRGGPHAIVFTCGPHRERGDDHAGGPASLL